MTGDSKIREHTSVVGTRMTVTWLAIARNFTILWYGFLSQEAQISTYQKRDVDQRGLIYDGAGIRIF
jgi:hypothetical protein